MTGFGNDKKSVKKIIKDAKTNNLKAQIINKAFLIWQHSLFAPLLVCTTNNINIYIFIHKM